MKSFTIPRGHSSLTAGSSSETNITVKDIVKIILKEMKLNPKVVYGKTQGGWKGDIPVVFLDSSKIRESGWMHTFTSEEAVIKTTREILGKEKV